MTKKKLIISLCAFVLVVAVGVVGVLAATSQKAVVKSYVGYTAKNVKAQVKFTLTHQYHKSEDSDATNGYKTTSWILSSDGALADGSSDIPYSWNITTEELDSSRKISTITDINFSEVQNDTITYKLTVTNKASEGGLKIKATPVAEITPQGGTLEPIKTDLKTLGDKGNVSAQLDKGEQEIAAEGTTEFTLTLKLTNPAFDIPTLTVNFYVDLVAVPTPA